MSAAALSRDCPERETRLHLGLENHAGTGDPSSRCCSNPMATARLLTLTHEQFFFDDAARDRPPGRLWNGALDKMEKFVAA